MPLGRRKHAEKTILDGLTDLDPSGKNTKLTRSFFDSMTDEQFDDYISAIEAGKAYIGLVYENMGKNAITTENNLKVAKKWGHSFFHKLILTDAVTGQTYETPLPYPVLDLPVRRQVQMLKEKISIPEDNRHVDDYTNQPTGVSKGGGISLPETLVLYSAGLSQSLTEMIKFRGGDIKAMNAMYRAIAEQGDASLESISRLGTRVKSTVTMSILLKGMHLDNNF